MKRFALVLALLLSSCSNMPPPPHRAAAEAIPARISWPSGRLPVYDHVVIVVAPYLAGSSHCRLHETLRQGQVSYELLAKLSPGSVEAACPHAKALLDRLRNL